MFTLSRLRAISAPLARTNSTLEPILSTTSIPLLSGSSTTSDASATRGAELISSTSPPTRRTQGRRSHRYPPIRPSISLERPRQWNPPVASGTIPAYDKAVAYIRADAAALQAKADALRLNLENGQIQTEGIEDAKEKLNIIEIMAQVNLPEVRWKAANGMGLCFHYTFNNVLYLTCHFAVADMNQKVYRHLVEQRWRSEGALDLLVRHSNLLVSHLVFNVFGLDGASLPDAGYSRHSLLPAAHCRPPCGFPGGTAE